jgi:hypothetical protein
LKDIDCWNSIQFAPILCCFAFSFGFIFIQMDQIASYVFTIPIEKNMIFTSSFLFSKTYLCIVFFKHPRLFGIFSTCHVHLKIGTCSLNIMLNNNFNSLTPWHKQNPYNPRLNQKQALWASSKKKKTATINIIISWLLMK